MSVSLSMSVSVSVSSVCVDCLCLCLCRCSGESGPLVWPASLAAASGAALATAPAPKNLLCCIKAYPHIPKY